MKRIVVVGNVNADIVYRVDSTLGPDVETRGEPIGTRLGGSGANAASALAVAGDHVQLFGFVGDDALGDAVMDLLCRYPWDATGVKRRPGPTPSCLIMVDPDRERTIISVGPSAAPSSWPDMPFDGADCVYHASRWPLSSAAAGRLRASGASIVCQLASAARLGFASVVVASENHFTPAEARDPWRAVRARGVATDWLVVTCGARGAFAVNGSVLLEVSAAPARVVDTTGAGDAFAAGLVHAVAHRRPMAQALALATVWAGKAVAHPGSTFPHDATFDDDVDAASARVTERPYAPISSDR